MLQRRCGSWEHNDRYIRLLEVLGITPSLGQIPSLEFFLAFFFAVLCGCIRRTSSYDQQIEPGWKPWEFLWENLKKRREKRGSLRFTLPWHSRRFALKPFGCEALILGLSCHEGHRPSAHIGHDLSGPLSSSVFQSCSYSICTSTNFKNLISVWPNLMYFHPSLIQVLPLM